MRDDVWVLEGGELGVSAHVCVGGSTKKRIEEEEIGVSLDASDDPAAGRFERIIFWIQRYKQKVKKTNKKKTNNAERMAPTHQPRQKKQRRACTIDGNKKVHWNRPLISLCARYGWGLHRMTLQLDNLGV